jgi:Fic family protein
MTMENTHFSQEILVFHGRTAPETGFLTGYDAIIQYYKLKVPTPATLALISKKNKNYNKPGWIVFGPKYQPSDTLTGHLVFALKYEGVNLLFFKKLFEKIDQSEVVTIIMSEYSGQYMRKIWFLYEWLMQKKLPIEDLPFKNFIPLLDDKLQYASTLSINSSRHRIRNNLPGTVNFCPLIQRTEKLEDYISRNLTEKTTEVIHGIHKDILLRTSAFLLLKDSKASFIIEGEKPTQNRAMRWGKAIGQAGSKPLSKEELLRLQQIVIENSRFVDMGFRKKGGLVGDHDRTTGEPIPEHISARWQDLNILLDGLIETATLFESSKFHPVLSAAKIAFGFVFIHPFEDGNGRIHRYLIHHILSNMKFTPQGIIFPVSSAILDRITDYRRVLETYSQPTLDFIKWKRTPDNNVEVLNDTIDYYRYFDATVEAEFLFECVESTINNIIPQEVRYLQKYDSMKSWLDDLFEMPDKMVAMLIRFLEQNNGTLSKRSHEKEFKDLTSEQIKQIEKQYKNIFEKD